MTCFLVLSRNDMIIRTISEFLHENQLKISKLCLILKGFHATNLSEMSSVNLGALQRPYSCQGLMTVVYLPKKRSLRGPKKTAHIPY